MKLSDRGIVMRERTLFEVRELTRDDLPVLEEARVKTPAVKRFRDPHHRLAKLLALGIKPKDAGLRTGYSYTRVQTLLADPAFVDLVARYTREVTDRFEEAVDDYIELATGNMMTAERMISEKLEAADDEGETLPTRDLIAISRDAADRLGYGKKNTNLNVNVDFAANLERAIRRSAEAREPKLISSVVPPSSPPLVPQTPTRSGNLGVAQPPVLIRRRA